MKKIFLILIICFIFVPFVFADDDIEMTNEIAEEAELDSGEELALEEEYEEKEKKPFFSNRSFELGLLNIGLGFSNNFLTTGQIFREKAVVDFDELRRGFKFNLGFALSPLYFNYNKDDEWGFGLSTGVNAIGAVDLAQDMIKFKQTNNAESDIAGAAFAEVVPNAFFYVQQFKVKVKLGVYYPVFYMYSKDFSYKYKNTITDDGLETELFLGVDLRMYTAFPMEDEADFKLSAGAGVDLSLSVDYSLSEVLGLTELFSFLDFDVGVDLINVPIVPSTMRHYMRILGNVGEEGKVIDIFDDETDWENFVNFDEPEYFEGGRNVFRPFKMLFRADWRPFVDIKFISFVPTLGFAVNPMYSKPASFEGGIKANANLSNILLASLGIGYHDRVWINSLDLGLNLRVFQFDLGLSLQSADFVKSWSGGGFGLNVGFRFGW